MPNGTIIAIAVSLVSAGLAWYLSGRILNQSDENQSENPLIDSEPLPRRRSTDIWEGFVHAHENNPPFWPENDSWSSEFTR